MKHYPPSALLTATVCGALAHCPGADAQPITFERDKPLVPMAHPGLKLEVEGHTDSTGSDELNQRLSERRSDTVKTYLEDPALAL